MNSLYEKTRLLIELYEAPSQAKQTSAFDYLHEKKTHSIILVIYFPTDNETKLYSKLYLSLIKQVDLIC